jgi:hypothetical protein
MGQYHHPVCIEAEEGLDPAGMDSGLKEGEQGFNRPSTPNAIVALVCARGGNMPADCSQSPMIGRWAGNRVLIQGDYAADDDIPGWKGPKLSKPHRAMRPVEYRKCKKDWQTTPVFTDITREACAFLEAAMSATSSRNRSAQMETFAPRPTVKSLTAGRVPTPCRSSPWPGTSEAAALPSI